MACAEDKTVDLGNDRIITIGAALSDYAGSWEGYAEAYTFSDGSETVRFDVDDSGQGTLRVGDAPAISLPADISRDVAHRYLSPLSPGFVHPFSGARVDGNRVRATFAVADMFDAACAAITPKHTVAGPLCAAVGPQLVPIDQKADGNPCVVNSSSSMEEYRCPEALCFDVCSCTEAACQAGKNASNSNPDVTIDGALADDGNTFAGTLAFDYKRIAVRLTRKK